MKLFVKLLIMGWGICSVVVSQNLSSRVLVVYNNADTRDQNANGVSDVSEIVQYYQSVRQIPSENILGITAPVQEEIERAAFDAAYDTAGTYLHHIRQDVENYLMCTEDQAGQRLKEKIYYIILVKGIPLKIKSVGIGSDVYTADYSSVDASLALLFQNGPIAGRISNPYFCVDPNNTLSKKFRSFAYANGQVTLSYLITRFDGYTTEDVMDMITRAQNTDHPELTTWVLDDHNKPYDRMFAAYNALKAVGQHVSPDPWTDNTTWITSSPRPVMGYVGHGIYAGMPSSYLSTTLSLNYARGAIFSSYESFNGATFERTGAQGQVADFIKAGGTGGIGNVYEPWSSGIVHEEILFPMYAIGYNLAEASYMAQQYLDWTTVVVGDPLCQIVSPQASIAVDFAAEELSGFAPLSVCFNERTVSKATIPSQWMWDFDDNGSIDSYEPNPSFVFNEPGIYSVKLTVSDGIRSEALTKENYVNVRARSYLDSTTVLLAQENITMSNDVKLVSGDIIVNAQGSNTELSIGNACYGSSRYTLKADRISIGTGCVLPGSVFYNQMDNQGIISGVQTAALSIPVISDWPTFQTGAAGTQSVSIKRGSITLAAGSYADVTVPVGTTLILSGGVYRIRSLTIGDKGIVDVSKASDIMIGEKMTVGINARIGPKSKTTVKSSDIRFYIAAYYSAPSYALSLGNGSVLIANIYAPNGHCVTGSSVKITGAMIAKTITIGAYSQIILSSCWSRSNFISKQQEADMTVVKLETVILHQNYPNPFNPTTTIRFELSEAQEISISVYNVLGQEVQKLLEGKVDGGMHQITWDGRDRDGQAAATGMYIYRVKTASGVVSRKMMLMK